MSNYVENNLGREEKIILKAKKSWLCLIPQILFFILCILVGVACFLIIDKGVQRFIWPCVFIIAGLILLIIRIVQIASIDLAITNKRVVGKIGVLSINTLDVHIDKIDHVQIQANFFGRLFHYYSLKVISVGGSGFDNGSSKNKGFIGIANAQEFKNIVTEAIEQHAQDARKAQAEEIARAMGKTV